jgi:glutamate racemase
MQPLRPIGVFDSGVGGLSVLREIRRALPGEDLLYVADSGNAPYGDRDDAFIAARVQAMVGFFQRAEVKAVVVACNTASAVARLVQAHAHSLRVLLQACPGWVAQVAPELVRRVPPRAAPAGHRGTERFWTTGSPDQAGKTIYALWGWPAQVRALAPC